MNEEVNKIINWIQKGYVRLNYKEELTIIKYIEQLQQENQELKRNCNIGYENIKTQKLVIDNLSERITKAIEYIENHSLYEEEYDYDYEENSYLSGIDDETAKKDLLEILKGVE